MLVMVVMFSCIGREFFAYKSRFKSDGEIAEMTDLDAEPSKVNYDTFMMSMNAISLILLNEEWHMQMYDLMRCFTRNVVAFYIVAIIIGEITIMKLFLALFINNYLEIITQKGVLQIKKDEEEE